MLVKPTIFDIGAPRNEEQQDAFNCSYLIWILWGVVAFILFLICFVLAGVRGVGFAALLSTVAFIPALMIFSYYYDESITPTKEQIDEYNESCGIFAPGLPTYEDDE